VSKFKQYSKEQLGKMLEGIFAQHPDQPTFLALSDTNVFYDDEGGRKLATEQAARSNSRIFRFKNPRYAETQDSGSGVIIEDGDGDSSAAQEANIAPIASTPIEEGDVTSQVSAEVASDKSKDKATDARKEGVSRAKATNSGVKSKR